jgi:hypothetical protein
MVNDCYATIDAIRAKWAMDLTGLFVLPPPNPLLGTFDRFRAKHFPNGVKGSGVTLAQFERMLKGELVEIVGLFNADGELYRICSDDSPDKCDVSGWAAECEAFTHSHPLHDHISDAPHTLSFADIQAGFVMGASEVRAVAPEGIYAATLAQKPELRTLNASGQILLRDWSASSHFIDSTFGLSAEGARRVHKFWIDSVGGPLIASYSFTPWEALS